MLRRIFNFATTPIRWAWQLLYAMLYVLATVAVFPFRMLWTIARWLHIDVAVRKLAALPGLLLAVPRAMFRVLIMPPMRFGGRHPRMVAGLTVVCLIAGVLYATQDFSGNPTQITEDDLFRPAPLATTEKPAELEPISAKPLAAVSPNETDSRYGESEIEDRYAVQVATEWTNEDQAAEVVPAQAEGNPPWEGNGRHRYPRASSGPRSAIATGETRDVRRRPTPLQGLSTGGLSRSLKGLGSLRDRLLGVQEEDSADEAPAPSQTAGAQETQPVENIEPKTARRPEYVAARETDRYAAPQPAPETVNVKPPHREPATTAVEQEAVTAKAMRPLPEAGTPPETARPKVAQSQPAPSEVDQPTDPAALEAEKAAKVARAAQAAETPPAPVSQPETSDSPSKQVLLSLQGPQLTAMAAGPPRLVVDREAQFVVKLLNTGDMNAQNVVVNVTLPPWVEVAQTMPSLGAAEAGPATDAGQPLTWRLPHLSAGGEEQLALELIPLESKPVELAVQWTYSQTGAGTQVVVEEPKLELKVEGPAEIDYGQRHLYRLTVSNPGTGAAEDIRVHLLPITGESGASTRQTIGSLSSGESTTLEVELMAGGSGEIAVRAVATAEGGLRADAEQKVIVRRGQLEVDVTGPNARYAATEANYEIAVENTGNAPAEDVRVIAVLPDGVKLDAAANDVWLMQSGKALWQVGDLAVNQRRVLPLKFEMHRAGDNKLELKAEAAGQLTAAHDFLTHVVARAELKLDVSDPRGPVSVDETAEYDIVVENRGTKAAELIDVVVFFSEGIEPLKAEGAANHLGPGQVVFDRIAKIEAGQTLKLKLHAQASVAGDHVFRTEVVCRSLETKLAAEETTHFYGRTLAPEEPKADPVPKTSAEPKSEPEAAAAEEELVPLTSQAAEAKTEAKPKTDPQPQVAVHAEPTKQARQTGETVSKVQIFEAPPVESDSTTGTP